MPNMVQTRVNPDKTMVMQSFEVHAIIIFLFLLPRLPRFAHHTLGAEKKSGVPYILTPDARPWFYFGEALHQAYDTLLRTLPGSFGDSPAPLADVHCGHAVSEVLPSANHSTGFRPEAGRLRTRQCQRAKDMPWHQACGGRASRRGKVPALSYGNRLLAYAMRKTKRMRQHARRHQINLAVEQFFIG